MELHQWIRPEEEFVPPHEFFSGVGVFAILSRRLTRLTAAAAAAVSLVFTSCEDGSAKVPTEEPAASSAEDLAPTPSSDERERVLSCIESKLAIKLPRPAPGDTPPEMTDEQSATFFDCLLELKLEKSFISPAGLEALEIADRIAARNRRERECLQELGWELVPTERSGDPAAIESRPAGAGSEQALIEDLVECGLTKDEAEAGFSGSG